MTTTAESTHPLPQAIAELIRSQILGLPQALDIGEDLFARGLDSMGIMQLLLVLGEHFQVEIPYREVTAENFQTCTAIAALVRRTQD